MTNEGKRYRVLVVDDDSITLEVLAGVLSDDTEVMTFSSSFLIKRR